MNIITYSLEKKIPIFIQFNLTRRCNLRCVHCCLEDGEKPEGDRGNDTNRELNLPEIRAVLEQLAQAGCLVLTFSGGEVLLREDLIDIISSARKLDFAVRIFTNGTLVGKREIEAFRRFHIQEVHVSLYAAEASIHDAITSVPGSWAKTLEGVRLMREAGIPVKIK